MRRLPQSAWKLWLAKIKRARRTCLFLDYDGTLSPIQPRPELAHLTLTNRESLKRLARNPKVHIAIVSGRSLREVRSKIKIKGLIYAGNHGIQIQGPGMKYVHPAVQKEPQRLKRIARQLGRLVKKYRGAFVENKRYTLTLHYRALQQKDALRLLQEARQVLDPLQVQGHVRLTKAKKALEVRPKVQWDKGKAVRWILEKLQPSAGCALYAGDDHTDEHAFQALKGKGLTLRVGRLKGSLAQFYVPSPLHFEKLLKEVAQIQGI